MLDMAYLDWPVYQMPKREKRELLTERLKALTQHHYNHCKEYASLLNAYGVEFNAITSLENIPFFPVRLFKSYELRSVPENEVFKVLTSSGTTSQTVSRIHLDRNTAAAQTRALVRIMQSFLGKQRLPMLIVDHPGVIKNRHSFSARGAGILGLSNFGRNHTYALRDENMELDMEVIEAFLDKNRNEKIFVFGFTFMIWKYLVQTLERMGKHIEIPDAILIHSGGWKKLHDEAVDNRTFKRRLQSVTGIQSVHDFYGMVEQVGSVYMECEHGFLHAPSYSDILIRDPYDWSVRSVNQPGVVQVLSTIPTSYPGHSLLTEDIGTLHGEDDCACGRAGKYFTIQGRLKRAEIRGCSDTHAADQH
ncbi:acyl-protein synthetase [Prosthecochloris sp. HL-130-GSB]|uniref:LuxE/PaaK family acyltransferase n=1 Tax=Prosthecochloris sp. HL-130-GSB TaxID=1974213 RepID=UPI000A1C11DC|nr:acyl-protein synthetase [Prosthecochloris sp. HL-130-GSB]